MPGWHHEARALVAHPTESWHVRLKEWLPNAQARLPWLTNVELAEHLSDVAVSDDYDFSEYQIYASHVLVEAERRLREMPDRST